MSAVTFILNVTNLRLYKTKDYVVFRKSESCSFFLMKVVRTLSNNSTIRAQSALVYVLSVGPTLASKAKNTFHIKTSEGLFDS